MRSRCLISIVSAIGLLVGLSSPAWAGPLGSAPASVIFPDTGVGACSPMQTLIITNNGGQMVTVNAFAVSGANAGDFVFNPGPFQPPFSIGAGVNFTPSIQFCPQAGGARSGTLTVQVAGGLGDLTIPLSGKAIGQKLTVTPSPINCGGARVNDTTTTDVTISNAGGGTVKVTSISVAGADAAEFTLSGLPNLPVSLGPAGQGAFKIKVTFKPGYVGAMHSARLEIGNDDPNLSPTLVAPLTGLGGPPKVAVGVGTAAFGNVRVGLKSPPSTIDILNTGNSGLKVTQIALGNGQGGNANDFLLDRSAIPDGTIIPAMSSLPIVVTFKPTKVGQTSAQVAIVSDDPNTPVKYVSLLGSGTQAMGSAAPQSIDFGQQTIFLAGPPRSVTFSNAGSDSYNITRIEFSGPQKDWFRSNGIVVFPIKVPPNGAVKVDLIALPLGPGNGTGVATFFTDDAGTPSFAIPLRVEGVSAQVQLTPPYGDFGTIGVLAKKTIDFELKNVGTDVLQIEDFRFVDDQQCGCFDVINAPMQNGNGDWPSLKPGESLKFSVRFAPQVAGQFHAHIEIDTNDPMARHIHIPLSGAGDTAGLRLDPISVTFPTTMVGTQSAPQRVTLTNTGGIPYTVDSVMVTGANAQMFRLEDPGKFDLAPGQSKVVLLTYVPLSAGAHTATLVMTPMGFAPTQIKLSGTAVQAILQVATGQNPPNVLDFDQLGLDLLVGSETDGQLVGVKVPANGIALTIDRVTIAGSPDFRIGQVEKADLSPGLQTTFPVSFRPSEADRTKAATISIYVRGLPNPLATVMVKGTGVTINTTQPPGTGDCAVGAGRASRDTSALLLLALPGALFLLRRRRPTASL